MNTVSLMKESEFHARVDAVLTALEGVIDAAEADIDSELTAGILQLIFMNGSKIIVNRQTPNREIWVAAKSGGFHFKFDGAAWRDTRSREQLDVLLARVISLQSECAVAVTLT